MTDDDVSAEISSLKANVELLAARVRHLEKCLDTLQTSLWKRVWFRIQRWPGQRNLNADHPGFLPGWLRRIVGQ